MEKKAKEGTSQKSMAELMKLKGNDMYQSGEWEKSIEAYTRGLDYDPNNVALFANRAIAFLKLNKFKECEEDCTMSLLYDPKYVKVYLRRATARLSLGKVDDAIADYKKVAELQRTNGNELYKCGKLDKAIKAYTVGLSFDSECSKLYANRAAVYFKLKKFKECEEDCTKSLHYDQKYIKAYLRRAAARQNLGSVDDAIADYKTVLKLEPNNEAAQKEIKLNSTKKSYEKDVSLEKKKTCQEIFKLHGHIDVEMCAESGDLNERLKQCSKNHRDFIPIKTFTSDRLPAGCANKSLLYQFMKTTADLTVLICVKMVSNKRPQFWPNTSICYPYYNKKGVTSDRFGTGEIYVLKFVDGLGYDGLGLNYNFARAKNYDSEYKTCPCESCIKSDKPSREWWEIFVTTAGHVIFDDDEARKTTCLVNYDDKDSPKIELDKFRTVEVDPTRDITLIKTFTCGDLGRKLYETYVRWSALWGKVRKEYENRTDDKMTFIVSHPHGSTKQISLGDLVEIQKASDFMSHIDLTKLIYKTSTCPGSSGAKVRCLAFATDHVHTGSLDSKLNYSNAGASYNKKLDYTYNHKTFMK